MAMVPVSMAVVLGLLLTLFLRIIASTRFFIKKKREQINNDCQSMQQIG